MTRTISRERWKSLGIAGRDAILMNPIHGIRHSGRIVLVRESWFAWIVRKIGEIIKP